MMADSSNIASGTTGTIPWTIDSNKVLHLNAGTFPKASSGSTAQNSYSPWYKYKDNIETISFDGEVEPYADNHLTSMFCQLTNLKKLEHLENFNTSKVTGAIYMFALTGFESIDLRALDFSSMTSIGSLIRGVPNLKEAYLPEMPNIVDIAYVFADCYKLTTTNLDKLTLSKPQHLKDIFRNCSSLTSLDMSKWNTKGATDLGYTFYGCSGIKTLDLSTWDTSSVKSFYGTFKNMTSLTQIIGDSNLKVDSATDLSHMFENDTSLKSLDTSSWNTSKVTTFQNMFYQNTSLKYLDLSSFTVNNTAVTTDMLNGVRPYVLGLSSNVKLSPKDTDVNTTGFISPSMTSADLNGYRYYKYIQGGNASNIPVEGQNIVRNSDFSNSSDVGVIFHQGANKMVDVDIEKDVDGLNMLHIKWNKGSTSLGGFYGYISNNNPNSAHAISKNEPYTISAKVKGKAHLVVFGYEDGTKQTGADQVNLDYSDWTTITRSAVSNNADGAFCIYIDSGELYVKNFAIFHGSTAYPYIKAPEDIYSMSPTNVAGGADLIHMYKEGSYSRLTSYWVRTGTTIAKDNKGNILSSTPNQIYDISSKPYPLYYTIPPVFKGYRLVGTQSGSKPVGMLDPNNMNVTYLYEPILDPSVNDLTKTTAVVNQGIRSVSYTKGNTKVTKSPDVANTLNLDDIIKDSGRTSPNE